MEGPDALIATAAYQPEPTAAAAARRFVRDTLQTWRVTGAAADGHGVVDDAVLLTSELVTNAVVHAGTSVEVTCKLADGGIEVVVSDGHPARLVTEPPGGEHTPAERTSGRGLLLPPALASAWGVTYGRTAKAVWFRIGPTGPGAVGVTAADPGDGHARATDPGAAHAGTAGRAAVTATGPDVSGRWPAGSLADHMYGQLLAGTAESARASVGADAAYVLVAGEDGDLCLGATAGCFPPSVTGQDSVPGGPGQAGLAALRAAAGSAPSVVTVPFVVDGRVTGLLAVASATPGRFRDGEGTRLQQLADRWGPPIERARLSGLERVRRGRIGALAQARRLLEGSIGGDEAMALAGQAAVPRLVPWCAVLLPDAGLGMRTAYARHAEEARSGALAWLLDQVCARLTRADCAAQSASHGPGWRWSVAVPGLAQAPSGVDELVAGSAWCFPLGSDAGTGLFAVGHHRDGRPPREVLELAADLACRLGFALGNARLASREH